METGYRRIAAIFLLLGIMLTWTPVGDDDLFAIWDMPDNVTVAAVSLMVTASGTGNAKVTVLLTPEEVDRAVKTNVDFSLFGQ